MWNQARLRTSWSQAVGPQLLAELVDISQNLVLLETDSEACSAWAYCAGTRCRTVAA